jgi:IS1 family transposase
VDAGSAAAWYQDRVLQNLSCKQIQADETWGFVGSKAANTPKQKRRTGEAGDAWLWIALDPQSKLVVTWLVSDRSGQAALEFIDDLESRLAGRIQLTTDSYRPYAGAVQEAFGYDVDYAQVVKLFGAVPEAFKGLYSPAQCIGQRKERMWGNPDRATTSTSHVERNNLNVRMHQRRMTRLTNAFSKKMANHAHAMALHFLYYNFVRIHKTLRVTPAMAAGVTDRLWEMSDMVGVLEAWEAREDRAA